MATEVLFSKPVYEYNIPLFEKIKTYELKTNVHQITIPKENIYAFYNDEKNPILIITFPEYNNYKIGYEIEINDETETIILHYIDKIYKYVFCPTERDFAKLKVFFDKVTSGNKELHDLRNKRVYATSAIRAFYVDKSMWINNNGFYDIYCDIFISGSDKTFGLYKKFLGMNNRQLFYLVDELDTVDKIMMKNQLMRVYPSNKLGINVYNKEIVLDASAVFLYEENQFRKDNTAFDKMKEEYLDEVHNSVEVDQMIMDFDNTEKTNKNANGDCPF
jgi:hypothetical protein